MEERADANSRMGRARFYFQLVILMCVTLFSLFAFGLLLWSIFAEPIWLLVTREHFAAVIGLPMAAVTALFIVLVLQATSGLIEFEAIGFRFRGGSGPVVLWVMCFLAITLAIRLLWGPHDG